MELISEPSESHAEAALKRPRGRPPLPEPITSLWGLLEEIEKDGQKPDRFTLYRGHTSWRHKLRPSIFRDANSRLRSKENQILRELVAKHPLDFEKDENTFEKLVRMQHYKLPTRLLDLTFNPLVATYFACEKDTSEHAEVISISVDLNHYKFYDSDTVQCLASLANLTPSEQKEVKACLADDNLRESGAGIRLFDFVAQRRPGFTPKIKVSDLKDFFVVSPKLNNPRISAQSGAFLIFGTEEELNKDAHGFKIKRYRIDKGATASIRKSLSMLNMDEASIYPSLESTANQLIRKYPPTP